MVLQGLEVGGVHVSRHIHAIESGGIELLDRWVALADGGGEVVQFLQEKVGREGGGVSKRHLNRWTLCALDVSSA